MRMEWDGALEASGHRVCLGAGGSGGEGLEPGAVFDACTWPLSLRTKEGGRGMPGVCGLGVIEITRAHRRGCEGLAPAARCLRR